MMEFSNFERNGKEAARRAANVDFYILGRENCTVLECLCYIRNKLGTDTGTPEKAGKAVWIVCEQFLSFACVRKHNSLGKLLKIFRARRDGIFVALRIKEKRYTAINHLRTPQLRLLV